MLFVASSCSHRRRTVRGRARRGRGERGRGPDRARPDLKGVLMLWAGRPVEAAALFTFALETAQAAGNTSAILQAYGNLTDHLLTSDAPSALETGREGVAQAKRLGQPARSPDPAVQPVAGTAVRRSVGARWISRPDDQLAGAATSATSTSAAPCSWPGGATSTRPLREIELTRPHFSRRTCRTGRCSGGARDHPDSARASRTRRPRRCRRSSTMTRASVASRTGWPCRRLWRPRCRLG